MPKRKYSDNSTRITLSGNRFALPLALCGVVFFTHPYHSVAAVEPSPGVEKAGAPSRQDVQPDRTVGNARETGRFTNKELLMERRKRFSQRVMDDLRNSRISTQSETTELDKVVDRITLLESPRRETDLQALHMIYQDYLGWLAAEIEDLQAEMSADAGGVSVGELDWPSRFDRYIRQRREYAHQVDALVKSYDVELRRLKEIVERRRLLRARSISLESSLADIESSIKQLKPSTAARTERENKARRLREELRIAQTEILSLDDIDENLLKHFVVMIHRGRAWLDRNAIKTDEDAMLREASTAINQGTVREAPARQSACRRVIRGYETERERLRRRLDQLDRMQERVSPAGTFSDVDRSRELLDFYEQEKSRYREELARIGIRITDWEAELSGALSGK